MSGYLVSLVISEQPGRAEERQRHPPLSIVAGLLRRMTLRSALASCVALPPASLQSFSALHPFLVSGAFKEGVK